MRKTVVRSFSIPPKLLKELERTAEEESRTYSELVREAIRQYLKRKYVDEMEVGRLEAESRRSARGRVPDFDDDDPTPPRRTPPAKKGTPRR